MVPPYEQQFPVRAWEIDGAGRVQPRFFNSYLQNSAMHHAIRLGVGRGEMGENLTWMLSKMRIEMERWPRWREQVTVKTWPSDIHRVFALRDFEARDADGAVYGRAISAWIVVNAVERRPVRLPDAVEALRPETPVRALEGGFARIPDVESPEMSVEHLVRWSHCDFNHHLGAQHYVAWAVEILPDELLASSWMRELDVEYKAEARAGDRVVGEWEGRGEGEYVHHLRHADDGRVMARLRTRWSPA